MNNFEGSINLWLANVAMYIFELMNHVFLTISFWILFSLDERENGQSSNGPSFGTWERKIKLKNAL